MPKFKVTIERAVWETVSVEIEAATPQAAEDVALDTANGAGLAGMPIIDQFTTPDMYSDWRLSGVEVEAWD